MVHTCAEGKKCPKLVMHLACRVVVVATVLRFFSVLINKLCSKARNSETPAKHPEHHRKQLYLKINHAYS